MRSPKGLLARSAFLGAGGLAYSLAEARSYRVQRHLLPVRAGAPGVTVLHVSDTHMKERDRAKTRWLRGLPERLGLVPDLVLATGDLIEDASGIDPLVDALGRLPSRWGKWYVFGSHDYLHSTFPGYVKYFTGNRAVVRAAPADTPRLERGLAEAGWRALTNRSEVLDTPAAHIRLTGVDDPYIHREETGHLGRSRDDELAIGLMHAPEVVSEYALAGYDLVLAGHTHGGQVRIPLTGAVVTNSTLPCALAAGPTKVGAAWLHVSPGVGQGRFAPVRFNCRPEVTLLTLEPRPDKAASTP
ncbi:MAG: metallophosphoesterase [Actinomycetota bacterium]|nr:metallophosphoesterase [Actinomycetota bacterium]